MAVRDQDPELFFPSGDCLIHFYERGHSRRGPSLRVSLTDIESSNCGPFLEQYPPHPVPVVSSTAPDDLIHEGLSPAVMYELYVPAPSHLSREDAFRFHITTRNFFAWMFDLPIVGDRLGQSLVALLDRMNQFRPDEIENQDDMLVFLDDQEYTDFRECPDHALAVLHLAETYRYQELWTDAFVHCAGMNDQLVLSSEFEVISLASTMRT